MNKKSKFLLLLLILSASINAKTCQYPYSFRFDNLTFSPIMATIVQKDKNILSELLIEDAEDNYIIINNFLPFTFYNDRNSTWNKIKNNENIIGYDFKEKVDKKNISAKVYKNKIEYILFVVDSRGNKASFLGAVFVYDRKILDLILKTIEYNDKKTCTENDYWKAYQKIDEKKVRTRLKALYSIYILNPNQKVRTEILKVLSLKKLLTFDLPISNIKQNKYSESKQSHKEIGGYAK